ncbi:MAG TPA: CbtA family protein [Alphaproteobacteria bacterium]|nr:CbtA family protein [Alphaproteobacteria bacterium]
MQKILLTALMAGSLAGLLVFAIQSFRLTPLILQAEIYEEADAIKQASSPETAIQAHQHAEDAWEPANGFERNAYRLLADLGVGIGFALILISAFILRGDPVDGKRGVLWGLAGFAIFSLAPGFGLPPELPATLAGGLTARQIWWLATVLATAFGLYALIFGKSPIFKAAGVAVLALPHLIGAPQPPLGGVVPTELNAQFAAASLATMAIFWVVLGGLSGWLYAKQSANNGRLIGKF